MVDRSSNRLFGQELTRVFACILERIVDKNFRYEFVYLGLSRTSLYDSGVKYKKCLFDFVENIRIQSCCSDEVFFIALEYINRLTTEGQISLTASNVHRITLISILLAVKFHDDLFYNNKFYAFTSDLSLEEVNELESSYLNTLGFDLFVSPELFDDIEHYFDRHACNCPFNCMAFSPLPVPRLYPSYQRKMLSYKMVNVSEPINDTRISDIIQNSAFSTGFQTWQNNDRRNEAVPSKKSAGPAPGFIKVDNDAFYAFAMNSLKAKKMKEIFMF
mmetsp:Transcript_3044/g.4623  ORF Transcript_3044/g.4623 Transcript_3044/m.4623 type:complete len:274 (+) Transcript_3044:64-885(+)